jgi:cytidyltransferase-like protein
MKRIFVSGAFDDARSPQIRFLHEASRIGPVTLLLWPDSAIAAMRGADPRMSLAERLYYFEALRYVDKVKVAPPDLDPDRLWTRGGGELATEGAAWALAPSDEGGPEAASAAKLAWCRSRGVEAHEISAAARSGFPYAPPPIVSVREAGRKRVVVTGCYDYLHTGHLRFFEEASEWGELNVVIGSDANVRLLKGEGHPLFPQAERSYVAGSFKNVARCLVSSGMGWLDAEPEIKALKADRYVVNEDGDKEEKREYCQKNGIEYIVLKRIPKEGLPRRSSTDLRGY